MMFTNYELDYNFVSGNVYKMSRNKDKYENNPRRQLVFLTAEEIAAGKKTQWNSVEITGKISSLENS